MSEKFLVLVSLKRGLSMKQQFARDLLLLERTSQLRELSSEEAERWQELATHIFGQTDMTGPKRKSTRLAITTNASVEFKEKICSCKVLEVSQVNLTLAFDGLEGIKLGDSLVLKSIMVNSDDVNLNLSCKVMRVKNEVAGKPIAGVEIVSTSQNDSSKKYFKNAYYPLYLKYLQNIASAIENK